MQKTLKVISEFTVYPPGTACIHKPLCKYLEVCIMSLKIYIQLWLLCLVAFWVLNFISVGKKEKTEQKLRTVSLLG